MKLSRTQAKRYGFNPAPKVKRPTDGQTGTVKEFDVVCLAAGMPVPVHGYRFAKGHTFAAVWDGWIGVVVGEPSAALANEAAVRGYAVLSVTPEQWAEVGPVLELVRRVMDEG